MDPIVVVPAKPIWTSKTFVLNALALTLLILGVLVDSADLLQLPSPWVVYLTVATTLLNVIARFYTVQPATLQGGQDVILRPNEPGGATLERIQ